MSEHMNINERLAETVKDMETAEKELMSQGFSKEHWSSISEYILCAIRWNQLNVAKAWEEIAQAGLKNATS